VSITHRSWLFLLPLVEGKKRNTRNFDNFKSAARNISLGLATLSESSNKDLVVLIDEVQATIARNEAGNLLSVLDELHANALTNSRVGLLGLKATVSIFVVVKCGREVRLMRTKYFQ